MEHIPAVESVEKDPKVKILALEGISMGEQGIVDREVLQVPDSFDFEKAKEAFDAQYEGRDYEGMFAGEREREAFIKWLVETKQAKEVSLEKHEWSLE